LAAGAFLALRSFAAKLPENISYVRSRFSFSNITPQGIIVNVFLIYHNGNPVSIPIDDFRGSLYYYNVFLAKIDQIQPISLSPGVDTELPLSAEVNFINLSSDIPNLFISGSIADGLKIKGTITIKGVGFDIDQPISIV